MKLRRPKGSESFFEAFSDLIFGTMAIFVLLFVLILTQIPPPRKGVDLVIVIDVSGSMGTPLSQTIETLRDLTSNFPSIVEDFRVGVVAYAYRNASTAEGGSVVPMTDFPLTTMTPDNVEVLGDWLQELKADGGSTDVTLALSTAIEMLSDTSDEERRRSLVLIGDVGPYEWYNGVPVDKSSFKNYEDENYARVAHYSELGAENRILTILTPTSKGKWHYNQSRNFYCRLAQSAGEQGRFTESSEKLIWQLMQEFLQESTNKETSQSEFSQMGAIQKIVDCANIDSR